MKSVLDFLPVNGQSIDTWQYDWSFYDNDMFVWYCRVMLI